MEKATFRTIQFKCDPSEKRQSVDLVYVTQESLIKTFGCIPHAVEVIVRRVR